MQGLGGLDETRAGWLRWSGSALLVLAVHAALLAGLVEATRDRQSLDEAGIMNIDLPPIAVDATTDEQDNAEDPNDTVSSEAAVEGADTPAPPVPQPEPSEVAETPPPPPEPLPEPVPEPAASAEPTPVQEVAPAPETPAEPLPEASPLAPEPAVTLPEPAKQKEPESEPETPPPARAAVPETPKPTRETKPSAKKAEAGPAAGAKTNSKAARAASGGGKFSPNAISRPRPAYPQGARAQRIEGRVVVRYSVSPSGSVTSVSIVSASPPGVFNAATLAAVRQWRFKPSATGGSGTTAISFKLK